MADTGLSGTGKTSLLVAKVYECAVNRVLGLSRQGVGFIDPHSDGYWDLKARLACLRADPAFAQLDELLVLIDPVNPGWTINYNPLQLAPNDRPRARAQYLGETIAKVFEDDPTAVRRMKRVLEYTFLALIRSGRTLLEFEKFLQDWEWREDLVASLHDEDLEGYWLKDEFPKSKTEATRWIESSLDRVGSFVSRDDIKRVLASPVSTINIRELMDAGKIVLIHAPIASQKLGRDGAHTFCAFLMAEFLAEAFNRVGVPEEQRRPFLLICDEYLDYATDTVLLNTTQGRKFGLEVWLTSQQVLGRGRHRELQEDVLATVGNLLSFKLADPDARALVKHLANPDLRRIKHLRERWERSPLFKFAGLGLLKWGEHFEKVTDPMFYSHDEIWDLEVEMLKATPYQHFWFRRRQDAQPIYYETQYLQPVRELSNYHRLPELLRQQDRAAFELCGYVKPAPIPRVLYLPARVGTWYQPEGQGRPDKELPLWLPYPFKAPKKRPIQGG